MKEFIVKRQTFVKSKNNTFKIFNRYTYSLIIFIVMTILYHLLSKNIDMVVSLFKSIILSFMICYILDYFLNLLNKKYELKKIFTEDNIIPISLIIGLFSVDTSVIILSIAIFITLIIKRIYKEIGISSSLYGILFILVYKYFQNDLVTPLTNLSLVRYINSYELIMEGYGSVIDYLLGSVYLSPVLSIIVFIYLFYNRSIKYNLVLSYLGTFALIMLIFGLLNDMNIWYCFFQLTTGNILFLSVFTLVDYQITPITSYAQVIYGIILGIITSILRFIVPELSVIITFILGPIILTKFLDNLSIKKLSK